MASSSTTLTPGGESSNYTGARNTCCAGTSGKASFKNGTIRYGTTSYKNGQVYSGGKDRNVASRVQTSVNKPWKHTDRGF